MHINICKESRQNVLFDLIPYGKLLSSSLDNSGATWVLWNIPRADPVVSGSSRFEPASDT